MKGGEGFTLSWKGQTQSMNDYYYSIRINNFNILYSLAFYYTIDGRVNIF